MLDNLDATFFPVKKMLLNDPPGDPPITPISLGIETVGGVVTKFVPRNTVIPTKKRQIFSTAEDNQNTITIQVYEGERPMTKDNHMLGKFDITGIPPAPKGDPQIEVTFEIDANGILTVSGEVKGTGNRKKITITNENNRLSPEDITRMINDAENFAEEDAKYMDNKKKQYHYYKEKQSKDCFFQSSITTGNYKKQIHESLNRKVEVLWKFRNSKNKEKKTCLLFIDVDKYTTHSGLVEYRNGLFEVLSTSKRTVGQVDFFKSLLNFCIKDENLDRDQIKKLHSPIDSAVWTLSRLDSIVLWSETYGFKEEKIQVTRAKFEELNMDLFKETLKPVEKVLENSGFAKKDIDEIVLVGRSTRIPKIQQLVKEFFDGKEPSSPPEMEATETQPQSDMETRTFPQMAEVQTEDEEELTSPPDPADKETGIHTEDDGARITGDVLVPDSVQSVSEEESGVDHIPGETVMPVTDVFPEDAINAETVAGTILQRIKNSKKSPKQCKKSPKQGKKSPKQGEEKEALALYQFKKFKAVSNSSSRVIVKALLKELILLLPIGVVAAMDQCDRNMVAENKSNPNQFEGFWALVNICNEMKEMSCKLCIKVVNAAVLLPCCAAAACDECARNMLVENELKCGLCEETDISPDDLIPNPMLRKKVAAFKNKGKEENRIQLVPAEIMLQKEEEKRIIEEQRKAAVSNIGDQEAPSDNAPVSVSPSEMEEKSDNVPWLSLPPILSPLSDSGDEDEDIWAVCYDILEDIMISTSERMVEAPNKKKRRI